MDYAIACLNIRNQVYEAADIIADFYVNGQPWKGSEGANDVDGRFNVSYPLGTGGSKRVEFSERSIKVSVVHPGEFVEVIPLLIREDVVLQVSGNKIILEQGRDGMTITATKSSINPLPEKFSTGGGKPCQVLEIRANGRLEYEFTFWQKEI
jgi:hypothetical protein